MTYEGTFSPNNRAEMMHYDTYHALWWERNRSCIQGDGEQLLRLRVHKQRWQGGRPSFFSLPPCKPGEMRQVDCCRSPSELEAKSSYEDLQQAFCHWWV